MQTGASWKWHMREHVEGSRRGKGRRFGTNSPLPTVDDDDSTVTLLKYPVIMFLISLSGQGPSYLE